MHYKHLFLLYFLLVGFGNAARAQDHVLAGAIDGKHAVHMFLKVAGDKAEASYFYDRYGMPIYLEGKIASGKINAENSSEKFTGVFDGQVFTGAWTDKRRKHELPFALKLADTQIKELSGRFKCEASRSGAGGGARVPLSFEIKAGSITRFSIESLVTPQAHTCNPDHSKFRQSTKGNMLVIESSADTDQNCPMSLRRAGSYLLIKNEGGACLCGARASIPDILLDTRNSTCRIAQ
jgi:hypothetical protein